MGPLLERRPDLALVGRNLVFRPVGHIVRGVFFDASWDRNYCRPRWYVSAACSFDRAETISFHFSGQYYLKRSNDPDFLADVLAKTEDALGLDFSRVLTLDDFLDQIEGLRLDGRDVQGPGDWGTPFHHAAVLAALGRLAEARAVLAPAVEALEQSRLSRLAEAEAEFGRRSNSAVGKVVLKWASYDGETLMRVRPLLTVLESRDRAGIAALLRGWEEQTMEDWRLRKVWTPSPFPIELGAGD